MTRCFHIGLFATAILTVLASVHAHAGPVYVAGTAVYDHIQFLPPMFEDEIAMVVTSIGLYAALGTITFGGRAALNSEVTA